MITSELYWELSGVPGAEHWGEQKWDSTGSTTAVITNGHGSCPHKWEDTDRVRSREFQELSEKLSSG